jgi:hypothetical protein
MLKSSRYTRRMSLSEWVRDFLDGNVAELSRRSGLVYPVVHKYVHGTPCSYRTAKRLSALTNGRVTVDELCEPPPQVATRAVPVPVSKRRQRKRAA